MDMYLQALDTYLRLVDNRLQLIDKRHIRAFPVFHPHCQRIIPSSKKQRILPFQNDKKVNIPEKSLPLHKKFTVKQEDGEIILYVCNILELSNHYE